MGRASYQHIDHIRLGDHKPCTVNVVKHNHTTVSVVLPPVTRLFSVVQPDGSQKRVKKPILRLKFN